MAEWTQEKRTEIERASAQYAPHPLGADIREMFDELDRRKALIERLAAALNLWHSGANILREADEVVKNG